MAADKRGFKTFSGDGDDPGKLPSAMFTLLDNLALEACEHLSLEEMMQEDGEKRILELLQARFPEKEPHYEMGEAL